MFLLKYSNFDFCGSLLPKQSASKISYNQFSILFYYTSEDIFFVKKSNKI